MKFGSAQGLVGQRVKRVEDDRLITGKGRYTDDLKFDGEAHGITLRSPYGHAKILSIDTSDALAAEGVLAVYTAADLTAYGNLPCFVPLNPKLQTPRPILAQDVVRYVGDPVAFIVAETKAAARAAAELVMVDYEELPAVADMDEALTDKAVIWGESGSNRAFDWTAGDKDKADAAFAGAAHVVKTTVFQQRVAPQSMEVRAAIGVPESDGSFALYCGSQGVASMRGALAGMVMQWDPAQLRIVTYDVGGGFGMKSFIYPEYPLVLHAAKALGRPVKWTGERSDAFLTDTHGRDLVSDAELALDADHRFLGMRVTTRTNVGAYQSQFGPAIQTIAGGRMVGGVYRLPAIYNHVIGVMTNTTPTDAYRGAGRPEACYITERLVDTAAHQLGVAPDVLRAKNLLTQAELPYTTPTGIKFDVGNFPAVLDKARQAADWDGFAQRKAAAAARGRLLGRGMCFYVEIAAFGGKEEWADARFLEDGTLEVSVGTQSNGQGHETAYAQVIASQLGIDMDRIRIHQGDTSRMEVGGGTGGSRSLQFGSGACVEATNGIIAKGKALAAEALGASDVSYADGMFRADGKNAAISLEELAHKHPGGLDVRGHYAMADETPVFPNGCHISEVEIDPDTGTLAITKYSVVDDFGTILNPMLVEGQIHGGVAQGLGQALLEQIVYDGNGQLSTGSFMDYGMPRADDMPLIAFDTSPVPNPNNPLGVKGCGEAGTIGAVPSLVNAISDALGGQQIDTPCTPEKIWALARGMAGKIAAE